MTFEDYAVHLSDLLSGDSARVRQANAELYLECVTSYDEAAPKDADLALVEAEQRDVSSV